MSTQTSDNQFKTLQGTPYPLGAHELENGVNFSVYVKNAIQVALCLFKDSTDDKPFQEVVFDPTTNKTGNIWHLFVEGIPKHSLYAFRVTAADKPDQSLILLDPYAKMVVNHHQWANTEKSYRPLGRVTSRSNFDWEGDKPLLTPLKDLIIYEMHLRGFTKDSSSQVQHPGTFLGLIEKIPFLKDLGINAIELLPVFEFNENETAQINPQTGKKLCNYFGYSTVNFFSPMLRYASSPDEDIAINEFKTMIRELHKNGIEVFLDVVYNHTFEGNHEGPILSFRGLDKSTYYMIDSDGNYLNFSGCGNTFNVNHPITRELIIQSLRYWVDEMHVDGFRFDLASIFTRSENGTPLPLAPIVEAISLDPLLANTKLIAEAWDAGGLYQVGSFYPGSRWAEWNGRYRDVVRRFIKGTDDHKTVFATAICGSQDLYGWRNTPCCSVNFVTAHDGFSLADLVTYNDKHNESNGENNRDGFDHNDSWNCGLEGHSSNKKIVYLRERQVRNFHLALMVSQGIPMILMGDEYAHTKHGNNNTWCQDNELNWFLWNRLEIRPGFYRYYKSLIHFRKNHPLLKKDNFLSENDITWHGITPDNPAWDNDNRFIAFTLNNENKSPEIYVAFNASHYLLNVSLPKPENGKKWHCIVNTHNLCPDDYVDEESSIPLTSNNFKIYSYSSILLVARVPKE